MELHDISIPSVGIGVIKIPHIFNYNTAVEHAVPPSVPVTVDIGKPIVDIPGCVEVHPENKYPDGTKNKQLAKDDDTVTYCDANMPSYDAMDYVPDQLVITKEVPPPPVQPPPDPPPTPETPPTSEGEIECPGPTQLRVGDLTQSGDERVIGHELQGTICVTLYEDTSVTEKYLPSLNQASTTAAIAIIATAGAAATPLLIRLIKPAIKKAIATLQKKIGTHRELSKSEILANEYRAKKGLPPLKVKKK